MNYSAATRHLKKSDAVLRRVIERLGPCRLEEERERNQFGSLLDAILYQQLAYRAAQTIAGRFRDLYAGEKGRGRLPRPDELLETPVEKLRAAGVSRQKAGYLHDLAQKTNEGALQLGHFGRMSDGEVIENLTQVKGIGRWTAEMFLIFCLGRPDVLPVDDLGVQYGFKDAYGMRKLPSAVRMTKIAEAWRPYRTIGTWYMWKVRRVNTEAKR